MALIECPECGKEISDNARSCPKCGYVFQKTKFCKFCGEKIPMDSVVCTKCGKQIENSVKENGIIINNVANSASSATAEIQNQVSAIRKKEVNKWTALLLCIFFGWLGVHKFYEGKIGIGILYIFTLGLFGIGWIIDIISIALKSNPYYT